MREFCQILSKVELHGLRRKERRELERRWRKEKRRSVPSPSSVFRYLSSFHNLDAEKLRVGGKAFIPRANSHLNGFYVIMKDFLSSVQSRHYCSTATLDMDATLVETQKFSAFYCYKGFPSYQPLNTWWAEQGLIVHSEFRDGNVPAGYDQLRVFQEALNALPDGIEKVRLRSDTAGYQHNLLRYCSMEENERFGEVEFAIGSNVTPEFKKAVAEVAESEWNPIYKTDEKVKIETDTQWAEVCFVPNAIGSSKNHPSYRYLAKRTKFHKQHSLPGIAVQQTFPFPTMQIQAKDYKVFGLVTNMDWEGEELIHWHHKRCGKSEEVHSIMKEDLASGRFPSSDFGENAAWWAIMILSLNLNSVMKTLAMGKSWATKRMKAIRFLLIHLPARVLVRSRSLLIRMSKSNPLFDFIVQVRGKIADIAMASG